MRCTHNSFHFSKIKAKSELGYVCVDYIFAKKGKVKIAQYLQRCFSL